MADPVLIERKGVYILTGTHEPDTRYFVIHTADSAGGSPVEAAFSPATMAKLPWAGVNLAIWYGFALIAAALLLALLYGYLCRIEVVGTSNSTSEPAQPAAESPPRG